MVLPRKCIFFTFGKYVSLVQICYLVHCNAPAIITRRKTSLYFIAESPSNFRIVFEEYIQKLAKGEHDKSVTIVVSYLCKKPKMFDPKGNECRPPPVVTGPHSVGAYSDCVSGKHP